MRFIEKVFYAALQRWWRLTVSWRLRHRGVHVGLATVFYGMPIVSKHISSKIIIGDRTVFSSHSAFTALGVSRPCILRTMRPGASISIGADTGVSGVVICAASAVGIGKECLIGADVMIADTDFHPIMPEGRRYAKTEEKISCAPVLIGDNVFIGARAIILKGVTIGDNTVIGAGSVVSSNIPPNVVAAGVPAKVLYPVNR